MDIEVYQTTNGRQPFATWYEGLAGDRRHHDAVTRQLTRIENAADLSQVPDWRSVGAGVYETRVHIGPGYRIYFAIHDGSVVLLLAGGKKGSQKGDIAKAKGRLKDHRNREKMT